MMFKYRETEWSTVASRGLLFSLLWWILTNGDSHSWWFGAPTVSIAVLVSVAIFPPAPVVWRELLLFTPFFLWRALQGGLEVAGRAFHPAMPIAPAFIDYPLRLPPGLPQVILTTIVSLLPGTLSATLDGQILKIHVLDSRGDVISGLMVLEERVARICGALLTTSHRER